MGDFSLVQITTENVCKKLKDLNENKAPGLGMLPAQFLGDS